MTSIFFREWSVFSGSETSMAISHEVSSEIVAALLAAKDRSPRELEDLKETLLTIHSTLQRLTEEAHTDKQPATKKAAAGKQV
jgi:hypothetical protein